MHRVNTIKSTKQVLKCHQNYIRVCFLLTGVNAENTAGLTMAFLADGIIIIIIIIISANS